MNMQVCPRCCLRFLSVLDGQAYMLPAPSAQALAAAVDSALKPPQSAAGAPSAAVAPVHANRQANGAACLGDGAASEQTAAEAPGYVVEYAPACVQQEASSAQDVCSEPSLAPSQEQTPGTPCTEPAGGEAALRGAGAKQLGVQPAAQPALGPPEHEQQAAVASARAGAWAPASGAAAPARMSEGRAAAASPPGAASQRACPVCLGILQVRMGTALAS